MGLVYHDGQVPLRIDEFLGRSTLESVNRRYPVYVNDFVTTNSVQTVWQGTALSSGTQSASASGIITQEHPGVVVLSSAAGANSGYRYVFDADAIMLGGGEVFDMVFKTAAAMTNTTLRFGLHGAQSTGDATDGAYFELPGTYAIVGKTANNSTRTTSSTLATLVASTWYHGRITIGAAGASALFEVFSDAGALLGSATITTNIPTTRDAGCGIVAFNSAGGTVVLLYVDYISIAFKRALVRGALS